MSTGGFIDTHSHIHFQKEFPDVLEILKRAKIANVSQQMIVGCTPKDSYEAVEFVQKHSDYVLWATLGVHPHNANELTDEVVERFQSLLQTEKKIKAIGEIGLDYFRNFQPHDVQQNAFRRQLNLAKEFDLAIVIHVREAFEDTLKILEEEKPAKVVLHCFSGDLAIAERCWKAGYYTSFSGVLTYPKNEYLREVARNALRDKIVLETDCPYLTPQVFRGKRNEPAFVIETAKVLADIWKVSLEEVATLTTQNAVRVFGLEGE